VRRETLLLLDRDGTLMEDVGYPRDPADVRLLPGSADAIRELAALGFVPAVVSNQSGIARGTISNQQAMAVHERFVERFEATSGVRLPCFYCPHGPDDGCVCRKPMTGLLVSASQTLGMAGRAAVMIGDKRTDVEAGRRFGARTILFGTACPISEDDYPPDFHAREWADIMDYLMNRETPHHVGA
jgi:D-glycero-D-manno-heptose 1,7-bisphosphate phosphatase